MLRVGYYQYRPLFGKVQQNLAKVLQALHKVNVDILVLPELAFTGYHFQDRAEVMAMAEDPHSSPTIDALVNLCKRRDFYMVTGFAEKAGDKVYNSALLLGPSGLLYTYRKLHLFNNETLYFDPGDTPLNVQSVRDAKIGMMVCFDWAFPEVARILAIQGADILCHPSNLVLAYCQQAMLTRCLENKVFAITTNRYGTDKRPHGELKFTGKSQIVAPGGKLLQRAVAQQDALFITKINPDEARNKNLTPRNSIFTDRRPEYYSLLTK